MASKATEDENCRYEPFCALYRIGLVVSWGVLMIFSLISLIAEINFVVGVLAGGQLVLPHRSMSHRQLLFHITTSMLVLCLVRSSSCDFADMTTSMYAIE